MSPLAVAIVLVAATLPNVLLAAEIDDTVRVKKGVLGHSDSYVGGAVFSNPGDIVIGNVEEEFTAGCGKCEPVAKCSPYFQSGGLVHNIRTCKRSNGGLGLCCPQHTPQQASISSLPFAPFTPPNIPVPITVEDINAVRLETNRYVLNLALKEHFLYNETSLTVPSTPAQRFIIKGNVVSPVATRAHQFIAATHFLQKRLHLTPEQAAFGLASISAKGTAFEKLCRERPLCNVASKYRTIDGSCNNLERPTIGMGTTVLQRLLPPRYADGIHEPRRAIDGSVLPSARVVSTSLSPGSSRLSSEFSAAFRNLGLFIAVDTERIPTPLLRNSFFGIQCCTPDSKRSLPLEKLHPNCLNIAVPPNDPFFGPMDIQCMRVVRSHPGLKENCNNFGYASPINENSHWLDGSGVYGTTQAFANILRTGHGGTLRAQRGPGKSTLLPPDDATDEWFTCDKCFTGGDSRINLVPETVTFGTLFSREHNRVVRQLAKINPHWNDEDLYQEGRRIVSATLQHIVYNEWLPPLLGLSYLEKKGLVPLSRGFLSHHHYRPDIDASSTVPFGTSALRMHSLVQDTNDYVDKRNEIVESIAAHKGILNPIRLHEKDNMDELIRGMTKQSQEIYDRFVTKELTNIIIETPTANIALDIVALNIQRGRENGVPGYNEYRQLCGLPKARTFKEFADVISSEDTEKLSWVYKHPEDVDLFTGMIMEKHAPGALVGPTAQCIMGDVFQRFKIGDRFFYELGGQPHSFTKEQLREIRKTSLARIMCDNSGNVTQIQPLTMWKPSPSNPLVYCHGPDIPSVNLEAWRNEPVPVNTLNHEGVQKPFLDAYDAGIHSNSIHGSGSHYGI